MQLFIKGDRNKPIGAHDLPSNWKITAFQRDEIYQRFLAAFPDRDWTSDSATRWMERLVATEKCPVGVGRIRAFIREAIKSERGILDCSWSWWVGCSLSKGDRA